MSVTHKYDGQHQRQQAFSLVELSIVLVILGLLVGGVLTGKSLIRAAQIRSVIREYDGYRTATLTFKEKYFMLPGDMTNATQVWGEVAAGVACKTTPSVDKLTCNGDGDGKILSISTISNEPTRYWQHLVNAELINGQYDGVTGVPTGRVGTWGILFQQVMTPLPIDAPLFAGSYGNRFVTSGLAIDEIYHIDKKIDDGKPATGRLVVTCLLIPATYITACTNAVDMRTLTADYNTTVPAGTITNPVFREVF